VTAGLDGVRVVDLSDDLAGPYCTKLLADAGADVVKVEPPEGDRMRRWSASGADVAPDQGGVLFRFLNTSKRSVVLDRDEDLLSLVATADLVVTTGAGLDRAQVERVNPACSVVTLTPFGREGPWPDQPATDFTLQALIGSIASRGGPDRPPVHAGGRLGEFVAGTYAAVGAMAALAAARCTGRGVHVDASMLECLAVTFAAYPTVTRSLTGAPAPGGRSFEVPSIEPAADGWVGLCTVTGQQWESLLLMIERPDLIGDERYSTMPARWARVAEVLEIVQGWTRRHTVAEILEQAELFRVPAAPVGNGRTVPAMEGFTARGVLVDHPGGGFVQPRPPFLMSASPARPLAPAPRLGQHTAEVLAEAGARPLVAPPVAGGRGGLPFEGLRVVDLTMFWAGPFATQYLASMGADVIKVESVQRPDPMRYSSVTGPDDPHWYEKSVIFHGANADKRGITLDLSRPAGRDLLLRLVAVSDVVIENFSPRVMSQFGLEYDELAAANPAVIVVRMPAFGLDGPWRDRVGFAQTMEQISGLGWITGYPDDRPLIPRGPCDTLAGMHALFGLLVAVRHRDRTGQGQLVEAPMVEVALNAAAEQIAEWSAHRHLLTRDGNRGPGAAPQGLYRARGDDRWVALAVVTDEQWLALRAVVGDPDWARDPSLEKVAGRRAAHDVIDQGLAPWFAPQDAGEAAERLVAAGIPAAPVLGSADNEHLPPLVARRFFETVEHPLVGPVTLPGWPVPLDPGPGRWHRQGAPTLGQDNDAVLGGLLGLSAEELARLRADAVIGDRPLGL
jgi:crotonobetainyl-CoA:carnitine CoA-transferase CaiB-like acyl-CoA transferase